MKHNNALTTQHFKKTSLRYKTWFHQPVQKRLRKERRQEKAKQIFPMNFQTLKPVVRCPSRRYNMKERLGRGFSLAEITKAGLTIQKARELGIAVDIRRYTYSEEGLERNVSRIKEYLSKIKVYGSKAEAEADNAVQFKGQIMPALPKKPLIIAVPKDQVVSEESACNRMYALRNECLKKQVRKARLGIPNKLLLAGKPLKE